MTSAHAPYFENHSRRDRFPWSLYHRELDRRIARVLAGINVQTPRILVVGCGLAPFVPGRADAIVYGSDLDERAIAECKRLHPDLAPRLATCPSEYEQPAFGVAFDAIVAKEVVEHLLDPERWARSLASLLAPRGRLVLTTPNYGFDSTLALLERTVLEWIARRDGYSRAHIHPTKFDRARLAALDLGEAMKLVRVEVCRTRWSLVGSWQRA
ncbi:hypothetical protein BH09MYX1_BH09MYX1_11580 [soil metagenome]